MPQLSIDILEKRGKQLAVAWLKYAYMPKALQKAMGPQRMSDDGGAGDPIIDGLGTLVKSTLATPEKENAYVFISRVVDYFKKIVVEADDSPYSFSTYVDYHPDQPLASWAEGLNIHMHFPLKFGIQINLVTGQLTRGSSDPLFYTDCEETPDDINVEALTTQLSASLSQLQILRKDIKEQYCQELRADLNEIIEDFDLIKDYAASNAAGETPMTPKRLADLAVSRIRKKAVTTLLAPLVQSIHELQAHVDVQGKPTKHRQMASAWAKQLLTTTNDLVEDQCTFTNFLKTFERHCSKDNIREFTEYKGCIRKILEAFTNLVYRMTNIQFFKPGPATDKLARNVVHNQDVLSVFVSSAFLRTRFDSIDEDDMFVSDSPSIGS